MSKMPPNRRGIKFEVGVWEIKFPTLCFYSKLSVCDFTARYTANIEKIDYENEKVLIHYRQWTSPYLRPMERVQLRREGRQEDSFIPGFHVNEKVLASWSDCRFYPAKVLAVNKDASYTVKFYDGVVYYAFISHSLYRVIRNQPPPVLSINLDHNPYKCGVPGCTKSFGKAKLLHYHMKYYHGDDRLIEPDQTRPMDKHTTLNNQDSSKKRCITSYECAQMSVKRRSLAPPVVSAQNYQRWPSLKDKTRENQLDIMFCHLFPDEDSISDRSSDSCGWSEDEMGVDLDIIASPLSCSSVASTTGSQETVRCVCEVEEENDFMLQCEECLYWQHGTCMGLLEENVPERYACFICWDSPGQRQRLRYWYDRDWLSTGHMYGLSFLENYSHKNGKKIAATHQLLGDVQHVVEVLNGLQLKISVLQSQSHRDLKLWRQPRKLTEKSRMKTMALPDTKTVSASTSLDAIQCKEPLTSPFQDYISSEHCYQKPQTLYQVLEPRLVLKTRVESVLEDRLHNTETMLKNDQHYNGEIQPALLKTPTQQQQWKISLLEHIETVQEEVTQRMDFIERELDLAHSDGELEPPEPLDRLPEFKHSIKQLLNEMGKVQQIALTCAT
uniref:PHD finger protein 20, a n=1 Tax=Sinocyclocheilus anshuiensis TaxID=1608454 RepID=A0A671PCT8_9TELE